MNIPGWVKRLVARDEIAELDRWRLWCDEHIKWLSHEFPDVGASLSNLRAHAVGKEFLDASYPPGPSGPWTVDALRENLRRAHRISL